MEGLVPLGVLYPECTSSNFVRGHEKERTLGQFGNCMKISHPQVNNAQNPCNGFSGTRTRTGGET